MKTKGAQVIAMAVLLMADGSLAQDSASSVMNLMKSAVIPQSDIIFAVGKAAPKTDEDWAVIEQSAGKLAVAAKTLSALAPKENSANWLKFSQAMGDAGNRVSAAVKSKNADAVLDAGDALYETCEGCHKQYLKK